MYKQICELLRNSRRTVFFGGAGLSTESGIPDFRSSDGIYSENYGRISPEAIISHGFFFADTETFYSFYRDKMLYPDAEPCLAHYALARLEQMGLVGCVITQNIDGLHTTAGSKNVLELHGSVLSNSCLCCGEKYGLDYVLKSPHNVPECEMCGGLIKPDVTLYGEPLPEGVFEAAEREVASSDLLIVAGTSLGVYPAANLVKYFNGDVVIINRDPTPFDRMATVVVHGSVGEVFSGIMQELGEELPQKKK